MSEKLSGSVGVKTQCAALIEGHTVEQLLCFDLISIQTRPCSVHDQQDIKNEALPKVDEEIKSVSAM
jgi:hypothetical protein